METIITHFSFTRRTAFLNEVVNEFYRADYFTPQEEKNRLFRNKNRATVLLNRLTERRKEFLKANPIKGGTARFTDMDGLNVEDVTGNGRYSLD